MRIQPYQTMNRELVSDAIYKYKESIVDVLVNSYTEMVEEI